jgi:hypothetical protein
MYKWLEGGRHVAIFSRDLSWARDNERLKELLVKKASGQELTLVLPNEIPLAKELKEKGAEVITYPQVDYVIRSRFTITNMERADTRVAVGFEIGGNQLKIEKVTACKNEPSFYLAQDLVELLRRFQKHNA